MTKKIITMLVIVSLFGFSTAYAYDSEDDDGAAGAVLVAGIAVVTAAILLASHDRHEEYRPSPRQTHDKPYDSRGDDSYRHHDERYNDNNQYHNRYQGEGPGGHKWKKWEGR